MSRKLLTETIGTFFLVFTIGLTVIGGTPFAPLAIGSVLMVMVYMGGHVSGGHYNPAVSLAVWMRGRLDGRELIPYWLAQFLGAFLAAGSVYAITRQSFALQSSPDYSVGAVLMVEFLFTFALALMVLQTATAIDTEGNSFYGLAIGFTLGVAVFAGGPISGGAFNPAVGLGPAVFDLLAGGNSLAYIWFYIVGPLAGGALAALVFRIQSPGDI